MLSSVAWRGLAQFAVANHWLALCMRAPAAQAYDEPLSPEHSDGVMQHVPEDEVDQHWQQRAPRRPAPGSLLAFLGRMPGARTVGLANAAGLALLGITAATIAWSGGMAVLLGILAR